MEHQLCVCAIICLILVIIVLKTKHNESFESKVEKVSTILDWWKSNPNPAYRKYKRDISGSDVIEYNKVKKIVKTGGDVNVETISSVVN